VCIFVAFLKNYITIVFTVVRYVHAVCIGLVSWRINVWSKCNFYCST